MNYSNLSQKSQLFLNKAMDIYSAIKDKHLNIPVKDLPPYRTLDSKYQFTELDKKVLALFIAGFLVNQNLRKMFSRYSDLKLDDFLNFICIDENDIEPIKNEKYEKFFEEHLEVILTHIIKKNYGSTIHFITPEVIIYALRFISIQGSNILDYFACIYHLPKCSSWGFNVHPLFDDLYNYIHREGSIVDIDPSKRNNDELKSSSATISPLKKENSKPLLQIQKQQNATKTDESRWLLIDEIQKKFIGQEAVTERLFYNIVNNQLLAEMKNIPDDQKSIIFLDGSTGTGKTAITREITKKLEIPFISTSMTNYFSTGYVGEKLIDLLKELYKKSGYDLEKAQRGIIVLDEFDKIAYCGSHGIEIKKEIQQQLLHFLDGGKYNICIDENSSGSHEIEFDTSKLTFICLGTLTDLHSKKFDQSAQSFMKQYYTITPEDLITIGLERELVGRFNTYLHTDNYSKESLKKILEKSTISPFIAFKHWIEYQGKQLVIDEDVYDLIAEQAYELNTGARGLQTVMNNIRTEFIKEVLRGTSDTIHLDSETVMKTSGQIINRKVKK